VIGLPDESPFLLEYFLLALKFLGACTTNWPGALEIW
jgi:hypothetical protein